MARAFTGGASVEFHNANKGIDGPFTVACWIYETTSTYIDGRAIVNYGRGGTSSTRGWHLSVNGSQKAELRTFPGTAGQAVAGTTTIALDTWYHVAGVKEASGTATSRIYVNGVSEATNTVDTVIAPNSTDDFFIGVTIPADSTGRESWRGRICEVFYWQAALTADEIKAAMYGRATKIRRDDLKIGSHLTGRYTTEVDIVRKVLADASGGTYADHAPIVLFSVPRSYPELAAGPATQTISPSAISQATAFGSATLSTGAVTVSPSAYAQTISFGSLQVSPGLVSVAPPSFTHSFAFGDPTTSLVTYLEPDGFGVSAVCGDVTIVRGAVQIAPESTVSSAQFGNAELFPEAVTLNPESTVLDTSFGTAVLSSGGVTLSPSGIANLAVFGTATLARGNVNVSPTGFEIVPAFGDSTVSFLTIVSPDGIGTSVTSGVHTVNRGAYSLLPVSFDVTNQFGQCSVIQATTQDVSPPSVVSLVRFGRPVTSLEDEVWRNAPLPGQRLQLTYPQEERRKESKKSLRKKKRRLAKQAEVKFRPEDVLVGMDLSPSEEPIQLSQTPARATSPSESPLEPILQQLRAQELEARQRLLEAQLQAELEARLAQEQEEQRRQLLLQQAILAHEQMLLQQDEELLALLMLQ